MRIRVWPLGSVGANIKASDCESYGFIKVQ